MMTARVAAEKLRQRDQLFGAENEALKIENATQKKKLLELEAEVKKLSGQQNLQQRIHHHAKIKVSFQRAMMSFWKFDILLIK